MYLSGMATPFFVLLLLSFVSFSLILGGSDSLSLKPSAIKNESFSNLSRTFIVLGAYCYGLIQTIRTPSPFIAFFRRNIFIVFLVGYLGISVFWSWFPGKVLVNFGHQLGLCICVFWAAYAYCLSPTYLLKIFNSIFTVGVGVSIVVVIFFPELGVHETGRWRGLVQHPNWLGVACMVGVWVSLALVLLSQKKDMMMYCVGSLALYFLGLWGSESRTSLIGSVVMLIGFGIVVWIRNNSSAVKYLKIGILFWLGLCFIWLFLLIVQEMLTPDVVLQMVGRDSSFTGRNIIWETGIEVWLKKPYFGWSFDSLRSVFEHEMKGKFRFIQFHSGYIDLVVQGGVVGMGFLVCLLTKCFYLIFSLARKDFLSATVFFLLVLCIILHNITEASFFRAPSNLLWVFFLFAFFVLGILNTQQTKERTPYQSAV